MTAPLLIALALYLILSVSLLLDMRRSDSHDWIPGPLLILIAPTAPLITGIVTGLVAYTWEQRWWLSAVVSGSILISSGFAPTRLNSLGWTGETVSRPRAAVLVTCFVVGSAGVVLIV